MTLIWPRRYQLLKTLGFVHSKSFMLISNNNKNETEQQKKEKKIKTTGLA